MTALGVRKFRSLLLVSCFSLGMGGLAELVDSAIAGHVLGDSALGAIGLFWPVVELIYFVAVGLGGGSSVLYSSASGSNDPEEMSKVFSNGLFSSLVLGLLMGTVLYFLRDAVIAFFGADAATSAQAAAYWNGYLGNVALYPLYSYLSTMVTSDGDERTATVAFAVSFVADTALSFVLCQSLGIIGCAYGTVAGTVVGLVVLFGHFFRKANSYRFCRFFSPVKAWKAFWVDLSESVNSLLAVAVYTFIGWCMTAWSGPGSLPVLTVVVSTHGLMLFLYGVGSALRPVVSIYHVEGDVPAIRRVTRDAARVSVLLGAALGAVLVACPRFPSWLVGLDDPALIEEANVAVRWIGASFPFYSLVILLVSYYVFIDRRRLSMTLVVLLEAVFPIAGGLTGYSLGGLQGFWIGYSLAPALTLLAAMLPAVLRRRERPPFYLMPDSDSGFYDFSLIAEPKAICEVSDAVRQRLLKMGESAKIGIRAAMLVEESLMAVNEVNGTRRCRCEVSLEVYDGYIRIIMRDDGTVFTLSHDTPGVESVRSVVLGSTLKSLDSRFGYAALGLNRNVFVIRENTSL